MGWLPRSRARTPGNPAHAGVWEIEQAPLDPRNARRARRVGWLLIGIAALSAGDLALTLTFLMHTGMAEANPMARAVIELGSPWLLAGWKAATVLCAAAILFAFRYRASGELGAWAGAIVLACLTLHWGRYVTETVSAPVCASVDPALLDHRWVRIEPTR